MGAGGGPFGRVPGVQLAYDLAPGQRNGRGRFRECHLRKGGRAGPRCPRRGAGACTGLEPALDPELALGLEQRGPGGGEGGGPDTATTAAAGAAARTAAAPGPVPPTVRGAAPWPEVLAARAVVDRLVTSWDDDLARSVFAGNMELDEALADRRSRLEAALAEVGPLRRAAPDPGYSGTEARLEWRIPGRHGTLKCALSLTPETHPGMQELSFTVEQPPLGAESDGASPTASPAAST